MTARTDILTAVFLVFIAKIIYRRFAGFSFVLFSA